jgi:hypothetical protein
MTNLASQIDRFTASSAGAPDEIVVRPLENARELVALYRLTHECYLENGYIQPQPNGLLAHYPAFDHLSETTILVALCGEEVVGSISITRDGPQKLTVDEDFGSTCDAIRAEGRTLAAAWRLVVKKSHRDQLKVVKALIFNAMRLAISEGFNTWIITVNPKHAGLYRRLLNMREVGRRTDTQGLKSAPGVLLRADLEAIPTRQIRTAVARTTVAQAGVPRFSHLLMLPLVMRLLLECFHKF